MAACATHGETGGVGYLDMGVMVEMLLLEYMLKGLDAELVATVSSVFGA
jgi:hypothetical protein